MIINREEWLTAGCDDNGPSTGKLYSKHLATKIWRKCESNTWQ